MKNISSLKLTIYAFMGAFIWTIHFMLIYALAEFGCIANLSWTSWGILFLTIFLLGAGAYSTYKIWRISQTIDSSLSPTGYFLSKYGIFNNAVFTFIVAFQSLPLFYFRGECL